MKVLSFGEILWDIYTDKKYIGGAPLNFAAHLAKHGEKVYMLSALGQDDLGEKARKQLEEWGIYTEYVSVLQGKQTGRCLVELDKNLVPTYNLLTNVAYDYIECGKVSDSFDILYFGTLVLRSEHNYNSLKVFLKRNSFKEIFVDINIRPPFYKRNTVLFSIQNATILKLSLEELPMVAEFFKKQNSSDFREFAGRLVKKYRNLKYVIITRGSDGAYALDCTTNKEHFCKCKRVEVKSTVGAGDSFSAAFLHQYLHKNDIQFCLEYAARVAGFVVSEYDTVPNYNISDFIR